MRTDVTLLDYARPYLFIGFVQFLVKRGVSKCHVLKHISVAKKLNAYLGITGKHLHSFQDFLQVCYQNLYILTYTTSFH